MKSEVAAGVIAATPPAALVMILFTITTLAADPVQFDASSGGAALFAAAGVDATTASFDASLLFELGLGEKVDVAGKWCYEMGAESLEDLGETQGFGDTMDFVMEFAMALEPLPPIKKAKLVRRIRQALAKHKTEL